MIRHSDRRYGPDAVNRLADAARCSADGARAALESFYSAPSTSGTARRCVACGAITRWPSSTTRSVASCAVVTRSPTCTTRSLPAPSECR